MQMESKTNSIVILSIDKTNTKGRIMSNNTGLCSFIVVLMCEYSEYSTVRQRSVYRRTVPFSAVVWC